MSNKTDLDWLARNVHKWPEGKREVLVCWPRNVDTLIWSSALSDAGWITKDQWLARCAELQNKPSWSKAEEWAEWLAQDSYGCWGFFQKKPLMHALSWIARSGYYQIHSPGNLLLGDWRDTLEKRPEQNEFDPFVSIEDSQEKEMKQDNKWFERGELPPVGEVCEAYIDYPPLWIETEIVAHKDGFAIGWCNSVMKGCRCDKAHEFRPLRSEREKAIDEMMEHCDYLGSRDFAGKLFDAGYRKEVK